LTELPWSYTAPPWVPFLGMKKDRGLRLKIWRTRFIAE